MVRLADLTPEEQETHLSKVPTLKPFPSRPWVRGKPLAQRRVAIVLMSHVSVNYDRSGFQSDWNVVFPLERLKELARDKVVGAAAAFHYSFMGAIAPITLYEGKARELAGLLKQDQVDAVLLTPV